MPHKLTLTDKILEKTLLKLIPQWMTPNIISWMRFASIPFIGYVFWVEQYAVALILFFISTFSDAVDGSLARTRNMVTDFGKLLDPFADKLLIAVTALMAVIAGALIQLIRLARPTQGQRLADYADVDVLRTHSRHLGGEDKTFVAGPHVQSRVACGRAGSGRII